MESPSRMHRCGRSRTAGWQVSLMEDSLHAVTQWGGAAATLGVSRPPIDRPNLGTALDREAVTDLCTDLGSAPKNVLSSSSAGCRSAGSMPTASSTMTASITRDPRPPVQVGRSVLARLSNLDDMADGERRSISVTPTACWRR